MKWLLCLLFLSGNALALGTNVQNGLSAEDQKYYKNEYGSGMNQLERIDSTVKEINKLHGEIAGMKAEMQAMKKEIEELKKK
jgi:peptidoglycan hydrolase CwlO-like protein